MTPLKPVEFSLMEVGETLGPVQLEIDDHFIKWYSFSVDDYNPWSWTDTSPLGYRIAPASSLICDLLRLLYTRYDPNRDRGLHQKEEVSFHSPVKVGEQVVLSGKFVDKYVKRGKGYVVTEAEARSTDGRLIVRHRATETADIDPSYNIGGRTAPETPTRWVRAQFPSDIPPVQKVHPDTPEGTPLIGPIKKVFQDQISLFSNAQAFWRSIHTDIEVARESGLKTTVAQGLMQACYISEWATQIFGETWFHTGTLSISFVHPVYPGDIISAQGVVNSKTIEPNGVRVEMETWLQNQDGVLTTVGWFSALIPTTD
jgi:acyl dehydratase